MCYYILRYVWIQNKCRNASITSTMNGKTGYYFNVHIFRCEYFHMIVNLKTTAFLHLCVSIVVISRAMSCVCHVVVFALSCKHLMFRMTPISPFVVPWHLIISINIEKYNFVAPLQARHCMQQETWHDTTWKAANTKMIFGLKVISSCIFVIRQYSAWENQHMYELRRHIIYQTQCTHTHTHIYIYIYIYLFSINRMCHCIEWVILRVDVCICATWCALYSTISHLIKQIRLWHEGLCNEYLTNYQTQHKKCNSSKLMDTLKPLYRLQVNQTLDGWNDKKRITPNRFG